MQILDQRFVSRSALRFDTILFALPKHFPLPEYIRDVHRRRPFRETTCMDPNTLTSIPSSTRVQAYTSDPRAIVLFPGQALNPAADHGVGGPNLEFQSFRTPKNYLTGLDLVPGCLHGTSCQRRLHTTVNNAICPPSLQLINTTFLPSFNLLPYELEFCDCANCGQREILGI